MRTFIIALAVVLATTASHAGPNASFKTGSQLLEMLGGEEGSQIKSNKAAAKLDEQESWDKQELKAMLRIWFDYSYAHGFIMGVAEALDDVVFTLPKELTEGEIIDVATKWLLSNPGSLSRSAEYCVGKALQAAYPLTE
jgi:hypothetical protein